MQKTLDVLLLILLNLLCPNIDDFQMRFLIKQTMSQYISLTAAYSENGMKLRKMKRETRKNYKRNF